eukprot:scaffold221633_cov32-Tisochrysis_lutea.AAC.1
MGARRVKFGVVLRDGQEYKPWSAPLSSRFPSTDSSYGEMKGPEVARWWPSNSRWALDIVRRRTFHRPIPI